MRWRRRMFHLISQHRGPLMLAMFVDGELRRREIRIGEGAERDRGQAWPALNHVGDGGAAIGAEAVGRAMAAVGRPNPGLGLADDFDAFVRPARLRGASSAGALLPIEAMADGDADG